MAGSYHWLSERYLSVALVPITVFPLTFGPSRTCDFLLGILLPLHCHLGFEQIVMDYLNKRKVGSMGNLAVRGVVSLGTVLTMYGLWKFNTRDVGITEFVRDVWRGPGQVNETKEAKNE